MLNSAKQVNNQGPDDSFLELFGMSEEDEKVAERALRSFEAEEVSDWGERIGLLAFLPLNWIISWLTFYEKNQNTDKVEVTIVCVQSVF